jgi:hypothetical protein
LTQGSIVTTLNRIMSRGLGRIERAVLVQIEDENEFDDVLTDARPQRVASGDRALEGRGPALTI